MSAKNRRPQAAKNRRDNVKRMRSDMPIITPPKYSRTKIDYRRFADSDE